MKDTTLLFFIKKDVSSESIASLCLAMKKRGFGEGLWNGVGGKVEKGESIESAACREAHEEVGTICKEKDLIKVAELTFYFEDKEEWNQKVHVFFSSVFSDSFVETEEMAPAWFPVSSIPYEKMWEDDVLWLPKVLQGEKVTASFTFGKDGKIKNYTFK